MAWSASPSGAGTWPVRSPKRCISSPSARRIACCALASPLRCWPGWRLAARWRLRWAGRCGRDWRGCGGGAGAAAGRRGSGCGRAAGPRAGPCPAPRPSAAGRAGGARRCCCSRCSPCSGRAFCSCSSSCSSSAICCCASSMRPSCSGLLQLLRRGGRGRGRSSAARSGRTASRCRRAAPARPAPRGASGSPRAAPACGGRSRPARPACPGGSGRARRAAPGAPAASARAVRSARAFLQRQRQLPHARLRLVDRVLAAAAREQGGDARAG